VAATSGLSEPSESEWWGLIVDAIVNDSGGPYYGSTSVSINTQGLPGYVISLYLSGAIDAESLSEYINYVDPNGNQMPGLLDQMGATEQYESDLAAIKWGDDKDYIVSQCTDGTCPNSDMQAWYDRWLASGSPDTKDGMWTQAEYDEWLSTQEPDPGPDPGPEGSQTLDELFEQIAAEEQVDKTVVEGVADIISTVKGAVPTDLEKASDLIKQVLGSTILGSALEECESWTGNTTTEGGLGVPSWTKCVDVGIFGIPGLDLPLPPGMIDISVTVYDIIQKGEDIGESFEDFINDPSGWLENVIDKAVEKVQEVWGDITSGLDPKNAGDLLDVLNGWIGSILGGYILNQVKDATEVLDPFLYSGDCANEGFQETYEGYCDEAVNNDRLVRFDVQTGLM
jgi:hypothetical protein